ncbi:MAG: DMT family transporter [Rhodobacteraceae bacterium]|nr:DMT family transporter [Paracoccaceae bacterium]
MDRRGGLLVVLLVLGAGWGITQPLSKIAVSEGYRHFGLVFWQLVIGVLLLGPVVWARGRGLPRGRAQWGMCTLIAAIGTVLPNSASYQAAIYLPSGVISILLSLVPILTFPLALAVGIDRFGWGRLAGLGCGMVAVILLIAPETSLPDRAMAAFIPLALIAPAFYAAEGAVVGKWGTLGLGPIQLLFGASLVGVVMTAPLALLTGQWIDPRPPWGAPDWALILSSIAHIVTYCGYVWLVGQAGAVFAAQIAYVVTGAGILWAMLILGESYSGWIWMALGVMLMGLFLVQPRREGVLVMAPVLPHDGPRPDEDPV